LQFTQHQSSCDDIKLLLLLLLLLLLPAAAAACCCLLLLAVRSHSGRASLSARVGLELFKPSS
jgi:hypothetical protein